MCYYNAECNLTTSWYVSQTWSVYFPRNTLPVSMHSLSPYFFFPPPHLHNYMVWAIVVLLCCCEVFAMHCTVLVIETKSRPVHYAFSQEFIFSVEIDIFQAISLFHFTYSSRLLQYYYCNTYAVLSLASAWVHITICTCTVRGCICTRVQVGLEIQSPHNA